MGNTSGKDGGETEALIEAVKEGNVAKAETIIAKIKPDAINRRSSSTPSHSTPLHVAGQNR